MAKKTIVPEPQSPVFKQDAETRNKILEGLTSEVKKAKSNVPIINEPIEPVQPVEPIEPVQTIETVEPIEPVQPVEPIEPAQPLETIEPTKKLSLFSRLNQMTEEDKNKNAVESIADNLLQNHVTDEDLNPDEDSYEYKRTMAEAEATGGVEIAELVMCVLCMWLSGNWSTESFEQFKIAKDKKKAIIISLVKIAVVKKKKSNPTWGLILMIVSASVPMLVIAFMARIAKNRERDKRLELDKLKKQLAQYQAPASVEPANVEAVDLEYQNYLMQKHLSTEILGKEKELTIVKASSPTVSKPINKNETRGRHKNTCRSKSKEGGACDCKN